MINKLKEFFDKYYYYISNVLLCIFIYTLIFKNFGISNVLYCGIGSLSYCILIEKFEYKRWLN